MAEYAALPASAGIVVCTDVLEHIEPACLDEVINHMRALMRVAGYFVIATRPDESKLLSDGRNPHLIIKPGDWWRSRLSSAFNITKWSEIQGQEISMTVSPC